jgi:hypothetical protein
MANNQKKKKGTMVSSKKKWTMMNPIWRQMKNCTPSSGQNGQLVHWWLLVHSAPSAANSDRKLEVHRVVVVGDAKKE